MHRSEKSACVLRTILIAVLLLPLISISIVPFYDTSEPRYAEIARIMAESGDWITPWFKHGVPFWGKPPLSFWAQAISMKTLGVTEFAARFPSWLCLILSVVILVEGLRPLYGFRISMLSAIIYSTCALVYISSGAVLTDPFLALGTTLSLVSFALVSQPGLSTPHGLEGSETKVHRLPPNVWRYGFFIGIVIGLLSKGPLALVLIIAPIIIGCGFKRQTTPLRTRLPLWKGLAIVAVLSLPWYILAEMKTPGFLDYFIVGEHFRRFLDPGWAGDLYGSAHKRAYGTIWLYWLQASFPWGLVVLATCLGSLWNTRIRETLRQTSRTPLFYFWLASALVTPLFFTFSANILWTYLLPSLAAFSVLAAIILAKAYEKSGFHRKFLPPATAIVPASILVLSFLAWFNPNLRNTERELVRYMENTAGTETPLLYLSGLPFSAQFYSKGKAREISPVDFHNLSVCGSPFYLSIPKDKQRIAATMENVTVDPVYSNKRYVLMRVSPRPNCETKVTARQSSSPPHP